MNISFADWLRKNPPAFQGRPWDITVPPEFLSVPPVSQRLVDTIAANWEIAIHVWFHHELGSIPSDEEIKQHGRFLMFNFPPADNHTLERTFCWKNEAVLHGYLDITTVRHCVLPAAAPQPYPESQNPIPQPKRCL